MLASNANDIIKKYAALSGLPNEKAEECLHNDDTARELLFNRQNAIAQLGIRGTPSFVISNGGSYGMVNNDYSYEAFKALIENKLNKIIILIKFYIRF